MMATAASQVYQLIEKSNAWAVPKKALLALVFPSKLRFSISLYSALSDARYFGGCKP
jgi:pyoverdine/dityrosine biosynthesis protein Dit1